MEKPMLSLKRNLKDVSTRYFIGIRIFVVLAIWALVPFRVAIAQQPGQKTFSTPEEASHALFVAVHKDDEKGLSGILGPDAKQLISSGDDIEDESNRTNFTQKFQEMHRLVNEPDGTTTLYIGTDNWPTPIPLVNKAGAWYFDTDAAKREILLRRIGQNELATIRVCHELVDAQKQYYSEPRGGDPVQEYAQRFVSNKGGHNGLYWLEAEDEFESPIDPRVADAGSRGGIAKELQTGPIPFHGYYFRILKGQGKNAPGGVEDYIVNGKMTRGFAFLAYPAKYRSSGVMTFIANQNGIVYQKDLGPNTTDLAKAMNEYDPDSSWQSSE
jgi:hypothetical protein